MEDHVITTQGVLAFIAVIGAIGSLWLRIESRLNAIAKEAAAERVAITNSLKELDKDVDTAVSGLNTDLQSYKLHVAETYMSKSSGSAAIDRAVKSIDSLRAEIKADFKNLTDRFERRFPSD